MAESKRQFVDRAESEIIAREVLHRAERKLWREERRKRLGYGKESGGTGCK